MGHPVNCPKSKWEIFTSPGDIAEAFNNHLTNFGQSLARRIPSVDTDPLSYANPVNGVFSSQRINVQKGIKLLKAVDVGKALKIVADVVAPSLTGVFIQSILTAISPFDWKLAKMPPTFKNGSKPDLSNYRPIYIVPAVAKIFEYIVYDQLYHVFSP